MSITVLWTHSLLTAGKGYACDVFENVKIHKYILYYVNNNGTFRKIMFCKLHLISKNDCTIFYQILVLWVV